ncbi:MAG: ankyrin repeat domain-containing protein [Capnocytophaga sp.]|nr:ankyrin repeat domain-containing protein [Capnocytophaga sp.]
MEERNIFAPKKEPFKLPEIVTLLREENLPALEAELAKGWDINKPVPVHIRYSQTPFEFALHSRKKKLMQFLVDKGAHIVKTDLINVCMSNNSDPELVKWLIDHGADVNARTHLTALQAAIYGKNEEIAFLLFENGYHLTPDGVTLRQAASAGLTQLCEYLIAHGFDVNHCEPDMVYPYNSSPLQIATQKGNLELVKRFVALGADLAYKDKYGERAYHYALRNKHKEVADYLRSVEPAEWHDGEERLRELKAYKLPEALIALLRSDNRRIALPNCKYTSFVEFAPLADVKEVKWKNKKFLDLLSDADRYGADGFLVWYPRAKKLAFADYEHGDFIELSTFEEFLKDPSKQINKIFE